MIKDTYELTNFTYNDKDYILNQSIILTITNYEKQLMGKWINNEFEDHLKVNDGD